MIRGSSVWLLYSEQQQRPRWTVEGRLNAVHEKYFSIGSVTLHRLQHPRSLRLETVGNEWRLGSQNALKVRPARLEVVLCML